MMDNIELNITQAKLQQLRCSICKGYLSCAPIRLLPDGSNICGRCTPLNNDISVYREPALEIILNDATFPCMFNQFGCTTRLSFGHTTDHESKCEYRPITCVSLPYTACDWEGTIMQLPEHFTKEHPDLVKFGAEFKIEIDKNKQEISMVVKNNCAFLVKYLYDADTRNLKYDVGYFTSNVDEEFCKIKLMNSLDPDYTSYTKGCKCVLYNHNFFVADNVTMLDIKKFWEILNNPSSIEIALILPNCDIKNEAGLVVDYELLESKKCGKCGYYLIPPVYRVYYLGIICSNCSEYFMSQPSDDEVLQNLLVDLNFPCRWRGCEVVAKGDAILSHEIQCKYHTYQCFHADCGITFDRFKVIEHLEGHNYQYFVNKVIFKLCYSYNTLTREEYAFTFIENEIVRIECSIRNNKPVLIMVKTSSFNPAQFTTKVHFEHNHCKRISKTFSCCGNNGLLKIDFVELPTCFKKVEELLVIVNVA